MDSARRCRWCWDPTSKSSKYPQASGTALSVSVTHTGSSTPNKLPLDLTVTNGADVTCE